MYKILTIVGARPQFIKAAALSRVVRELYADRLCEDILDTGQHYDVALSDNFIRELDLPRPRFSLGVGSASHARQTAAAMQGVEDVIMAHHYDAMIVFGDTNSTLAAALAAAKCRLPVFHVEAGLRSFNNSMPEEINRVLTDHVSSLLFAPTTAAVQNLRREGFCTDTIVHGGDVMFDNVMHFMPMARGMELPIAGSGFILATIHRDFNTDSPTRLATILDAIGELANRLSTVALMPLHPRTRKVIDSMGYTAAQGLCFTSPLGYMQTLAALDRCRMVITDSGGLQKEAAFAARPCVVVRPETEWVELLASGHAMLANPDSIVEVGETIDGRSLQLPASFGNGNAAQRIMDAVVRHCETHARG